MVNVSTIGIPSAGHNLTMSCAVSNIYPGLTIEWHRVAADADLLLEGVKTEEEGVAILSYTFQLLQPKDTGEYVCRVAYRSPHTSDAGSVNETLHLNVLCKF